MNPFKNEVAHIIIGITTVINQILYNFQPITVRYKNHRY